MCIRDRRFTVLRSHTLLYTIYIFNFCIYVASANVVRAFVLNNAFALANLRHLLSYRVTSVRLLHYRKPLYSTHSLHQKSSSILQSALPYCHFSPSSCLVNRDLCPRLQCNHVAISIVAFYERHYTSLFSI